VHVANWKYSLPDSATYLQQIIEHRPSACIRSDKGDLEAWVATHMDWAVGLVFTFEAHRKKGHARRLVAAISREIMKRGVTPYANIVVDNVPSVALFSSAGFVEEDGLVCWVETSK